MLNVVPGPGKTVGQRLVEHPDVDKVTFTGSPSVGRGILKGAAGNFKRVTLELGGKSANVIFDERRSRRRGESGGLGYLLQYRAGVLGGLARAGASPRFTTRSSSGLPRGRKPSVSAISAEKSTDHGARSSPSGRLKSNSQLRRYRREGRRFGGHRRRARRRSRLLHQPGGVPRCRSSRCGFRRKKSSARSPASSSLKTKKTRSKRRTARSIALPPASGARISAGCSASPTSSRPATVWINTYGYTDVRLPWGGMRDSGFGREHGDARDREFHRAEIGLGEPQRLNQQTYSPKLKRGPFGPRFFYSG